MTNINARYEELTDLAANIGRIDHCDMIEWMSQLLQWASNIDYKCDGDRELFEQCVENSFDEMSSTNAHHAWTAMSGAYYRKVEDLYYAVSM